MELQAVVNSLIWILGTGVRSAIIVVYALNCWPLSPVSYLKNHSFFYLDNILDIKKNHTKRGQNTGCLLLKMAKGNRRKVGRSSKYWFLCWWNCSIPWVSKSKIKDNWTILLHLFTISVLPVFFFLLQFIRCNWMKALARYTSSLIFKIIFTWYSHTFMGTVWWHMYIICSKKLIKMMGSWSNINYFHMFGIFILS